MLGRNLGIRLGTLLWSGNENRTCLLTKLTLLSAIFLPLYYVTVYQFQLTLCILWVFMATIFGK